MQDKDLNRHFKTISDRLEKIENTKPSEIVVGSAIDTRLTAISESLSDFKTDLARLTERVDNHIKFVWRTVAALFAIAAFFAVTVYNQNGRLSRIESASATVQLEKAAPEKLNVKDAQKAQAVVAEARRVGRTIDPEALHRVGVRFVSAASSPDPQLAAATWDAVQEFVNYRSFLNSALIPDTSSFVSLFSDCHNIGYTAINCDKWNTKWGFELHPVGDAGMTVAFRIGREVPAEKAAVLEKLDHPLNAGQKTGPDFLLMDASGMSQTLDGYRFKNIIFRGVKILYGGGPIQMENVYFVNCTFQAINKPNARELLMMALAPAPTKFTVSS